MQRDSETETHVTVQSVTVLVRLLITLQLRVPSSRVWEQEGQRSLVALVWGRLEPGRRL